MSWGVSGLAEQGVALKARPGRVVAVVGPDGSGKSTLLRALVGTGAPPSGSSVSRPDRRQIGYMGATSGTYPDLTVDENIAFMASAYGLDAGEARERSNEMLERMGLAAARDRLAGQLSGGMRQKLGAICAMVHEPRLLVLDEPTTGIDPVSRADLWRLIAQAAARGAAVVVSTSYLNEAERASETLALDGVATPLRSEVVGRRVTVGAEVLAEVRGASKRFGSGIAVDDVDLQVHPGEVLGLLGPNGAGKTTLIRMLLGLLPPTSGEVLLFGETPSRATRQRLGYVPQSLGLYDDLTPRENMVFSAAAFDIAAPELAAELDRPETVGALSRGLQRRVAFAQALAHSPDLLILDEPTSGVHPAAAVGLWASVRDATAAGAGALVTTHSMGEASECDRLAIMADGRVVAQGTLEQIVGGSRTLVIAAPEWSTAFARLEDAGIRSALVGDRLRVPAAQGPQASASLAGIEGIRTSVEPATLEERFLELTS